MVHVPIAAIRKARRRHASGQRGSALAVTGIGCGPRTARNAPGVCWHGPCPRTMRPCARWHLPGRRHQDIAARSRRGRRILAWTALARPWRCDKRRRCDRIAARFHRGQVAGSARVTTCQCDGRINSRGVAACHVMTRIAELAEQDRAVSLADHAARHWQWPVPGPLPIGGDAHRDAACRMFGDTFNPYRPSVIDWPALAPDALARLTGLPIWDIAVRTEGKARLRMMAYADTLRDPAWREAIAPNAWGGR